MTKDSQHKYQDYVDQYILNKLDPQERLEFEKRLQTDKALAEELQLTRYIVNGLAEARLEGILSRLPNEVDVDVIMSTPRVKTLKRRMLVTVITTAAAVVLCVLYIGNSSKYSTAELYNSYYVVQAYEQPPTRGDNSLTTDQQFQFDEAIKHYEEGDFAQALNHFNIIIQKTTPANTPEDVLFYSSVCLTQTGNAVGAITRLTNLVDRGGVFAEDARWNLALLHLSKGDRAKAKAILETVALNGKLHQQSSTELLTKLNKKKWF